MRFTLDSDAVLRKVSYEGIEALDDLQEDDPLARQDAEFALQVGMLRRLLDALHASLGGYAV